MLTLAAALHRRALLGASTRRRAPRKVPEARLPTAIALAYTQHLHGLVDALEADTRAAFERVGLRWDARSVRADAAADGDGPSLLAGDASKILARLRAAAAERLRAPSVLSVVEGVSAGIVGFTREEFARQMKAALGIDLTTDPVLTQQRATFRRENLELIRSLTTDHVERVARVLQGGAGDRVEVLRARIMGETGVVKSRASLIARDQVLKLNADVSHARHQAAGVVEYIWRTSRDERVRPAHRDLDGQRFRYDTPPVVDAKGGRHENPGGDFQCRCTAEPVLPDFGAMPAAPTG